MRPAVTSDTHSCLRSPPTEPSAARLLPAPRSFPPGSCPPSRSLSMQLGRMALYRRLHKQVCLPCVLLVEERDKESSL